jgi:hypothetical protein
MKILLDENIPTKLKVDFGEDYQILTVQDMGWLGKKNGELLGLTALAGFEIFITLDKNLRFQQNLGKFDLKFIVLLAKDNKLQTLRPSIPKIKELLSSNDLQKLNIISLQETPGNKNDISE